MLSSRNELVAPWLTRKYAITGVTRSAGSVKKIGTTLPLARSAVRSVVTLSSEGEGVRCWKQKVSLH